MRNSIDKKVISERINKIMTEKNLSEPQVALMVLGDANRRGDINKWRNGKSVPSSKYITKLAEKLRSIRSLFIRWNRY